jgi:hypothetical protein
MESKSPNSQMNSARSRHDILETVKSRYIKKFGRDASPTIESSIKKLAHKTKVNFKDFDEIENEIKRSIRSKTTLGNYANMRLPEVKRNSEIYSVMSKTMASSSR